MVAAFRKAAALWADDRGGIAVMGALLILPLSLLAFGAVEAHRYMGARQGLQEGLDNATLAVARSTETDPVKLNAIGLTVLRATLAGSGHTVTDASFTDTDGTVTGSASLRITPVVSSLFGVTELSAGASSSASRLGQKLEVALVLDNTYSMLTNDRLGITKTAATAFVNKLNEAALKTRVADALKISLVPYSTTVNVGSGYRNATWMDLNAQSPIHGELFSSRANRFDLFARMGVSWAGCVESRPHPYDVSDTPPTTTDPSSLFVPYFAPDEHDEWSNVSTSLHYVPLSNHYLPDPAHIDRLDWLARQMDVSKYASAPIPSSWSKEGYSAGPNYNCNLQPVVRLTSNIDAVKAGISAMVATGDTYSNVGLMWGWHSLSPSAPFGDGVDYTAPVRKIAVLMTDGENRMYNNDGRNQSIYSGGGYVAQGRFGITSGTAEERRAALDARMSQTCANMKARGIIVYTIRVEITTGTGEVLRGCASDPGKFYNVQAASELTGVFDAIAESLLNLRLAA